LAKQPSDSYPLIPVPEALAIVLRNARALAPVKVAPAHALGLIAASAVVAMDPQPPFAASVKDGYAVVAADGPGEYTIRGDATAGHPADFVLRPGEVAYITTGAPMPQGADAVVQVEDTRRSADGSSVTILRAARTGEDIRPIGYDVEAGATVVSAGERFGPAEIGLAAAVGVGDVWVHPRPRVGVLSTGDELIPSGAPLSEGAIHDSNGPSLRAAVASAGGDVVDLGIALDDEESVRRALQRGFDECDIVLTTGGVSMGELDLVKKLAAELGDVHFGRLLMKPGKPCTFATVDWNGRAGTRLLFALPGNPVSSLVTFYLLALPAIRSLAGWRNPQLGEVSAVTQVPLYLDPTRPEYHRGRLSWDAALRGGAGGWLATSTGSQASSRLLSLRGANALLVLPQGDGVLAAESVVRALVIGELVNS
jgi:gephyrin